VSGFVLLIGAAMALGSLAMVAWPRQVWRLGRGWRFADPGAVRLSGAYLAWLRFSGVVGAAMGIALIAYAIR
jgi:hypothetical protein